MKKKMARFLAVALLFIVASSVQGEIAPKLKLKTLSSLNNRIFGNEFFKNISRDEKNVFFSPLSVSTIMSQVYLGARGKTKIQIGHLGYTILEAFEIKIPEIYKRLLNQLRKSSKNKVDIANALITQNDFHVKKQFRSTLQQYYDTLVKEVDFVRNNAGALKEINSWVNQKTHGNIPFLVDKLDQSTLLVLLNAVYFKGTWQTQFDPDMTLSLPFYNYGGEGSTNVSTMRLTAKFPYYDDNYRHVKVLQLPYEDKEMSMLLVLPHKRSGIKRLKREININLLTHYLESLDTVEVNVYIPKFKLEYSRKLNEDFKKSGITDLFDNRADLSGITGKKNLYVTDIIHKAKIEVNEKGSEASAVTGVIITGKSMPFEVEEFKADHPFLFYIIHRRSKFILFVGSVDEL